MKRAVLIAVLLAAALAACGRKNDPAFPPGSLSEPPRVPTRGDQGPYVY